MPMYNLIEYHDNFFKISRSLCQYSRDEPSLDNYDNAVDFTGANHNSKSFK